MKRIPEFIERVKAGEGRLMGFGHRVYKNYDPRAKIIKQVADEVFEVTGRNPLLDIALELERIALEDEYFVSRKLYPNVDFYSGIIYQALGLPVAMFPVMFAIPRTAGWLAQWLEGIAGPRAEDRAAAAALHRRRRAAVRPDRPPDRAARLQSRGLIEAGPVAATAAKCERAPRESRSRSSVDRAAGPATLVRLDAAGAFLSSGPW